MTNTALKGSVSESWLAFRAASRFLFWSLVEAISAAIWWRKTAALEMTALHPENPQALFNSGYVCFYCDITWDAWCGSWCSPDEPQGLLAKNQYMVYADRWSGVPWHRVEFKNMPYDGREFRAVPKGFADKYLKPV